VRFAARVYPRLWSGSVIFGWSAVIGRADRHRGGDLRVSRAPAGDGQLAEREETVIS